jgi:hypothetical protein
MSHDLFGDPVPHLRKNANGYLADLAELQFEDEWHFWSLAEPDKDRPRPVDQYECVWLVGRGHELRRTYVDLTTGLEVAP